MHMVDVDESFTDLIRFGKISPQNEATTHSFSFSTIDGAKGGTCYWFCFVSSSRFLVEYSTCRDEVVTYVSTVGEAVIPFMENGGSILGSKTRRLKTTTEFIEEWKKIAHRSSKAEAPQDYINIPIVGEETDSPFSKILRRWADSGMMSGVSELGLRADGLTSTYWYMTMEKFSHVQAAEFGAHFGLYVCVT